MIIDWANRGTGQFAVFLEKEDPQETLAFPRELTLDLNITETSEDKLVLAALLAFTHNCEGTIISRPTIGMRTFDAILSSKLFTGIYFNVSKKAAVANNQTEILLPAVPTTKSPIQDRTKKRTIAVNILGNHNWNGRVFSVDRVYFGANLASFPSDNLMQLRLRLAVGLIASEEWKAGSLVVESPGHVDTETASQLKKLVASVGVKCEIVSPDEMQERLI